MAAGYAKRMFLASPRFPPSMTLNRESGGTDSDRPFISSPKLSSLRKYQRRTSLIREEKSGPD
jgi:hypothetical protein